MGDPRHTNPRIIIMMQNMQFHHVAMQVADISEGTEWYTSNMGATCLYQDETWALIDVGGAKIALVLPEQHPPHIAFECDNAEQFGPLKGHRDGTSSTYIRDPYGNTLELLKVPREEGCS